MKANGKSFIERVALVQIIIYQEREDQIDGLYIFVLHHLTLDQQEFLRLPIRTWSDILITVYSLLYLIPKIIFPNQTIDALWDLNQERMPVNPFQ